MIVYTNTYSVYSFTFLTYNCKNPFFASQRPAKFPEGIHTGFSREILEKNPVILEKNPVSLRRL